jgi:hypothetical protein
MHDPRGCAYRTHPSRAFDDFTGPILDAAAVRRLRGHASPLHTAELGKQIHG